MYKTSYVAAIDDDPDELDILCGVLGSLGILCRPIHYNSATPLIPELPLLRLLFLDLNLAHSIEERLQAQTISEILKRLKPMGPYIIIVWSQTPSNIVIIRERLEGHSDLLPPVSIETLDKSNYLPPPKTSLPPFTDKLERDITAIIDRSPVIKALLQWEARVAMAAGRSLNGLLKLAMNGRSWTTDTRIDGDLSNLLGSIACAATGQKKALADLARSIDEGLLPLMEDQLATLKVESSYSELWNNAVPAGCIPKRPTGNPVDVAGMNRHYLIEEGEGLQKGDRGVWVGLAEAHATDQEIQKLLGYSQRKELLGEFLEIPKKVEADERDRIINSVRLGFLELGAECDHAQGKVGLLRFALSVMIPAEHKEYTMFTESGSTKKREIKHQAIHRFPTMRIGGSDKIIKVNFRFILGLTPDSDILGDPLFRVRRQVLNEIAYKCAQHLARPGIVSF